jgi:hypothetical protein
VPNLNESRIILERKKARMIILDSLIVEQKAAYKFAKMLNESEDKMLKLGYSQKQINAIINEEIEMAEKATGIAGNIFGRAGKGFFDAIESFVISRILKNVGVDTTSFLGQLVLNVLQEIPVMELYKRMTSDNAADREVACSEIALIIQTGIEKGAVEYVTQPQNLSKLTNVVAGILIGTSSGTFALKSRNFVMQLISGAADAGQEGGLGDFGLSVVREVFSTAMIDLLNKTGFNENLAGFLCNQDWTKIRRSALMESYHMTKRLETMKRNL